MKFFARFQPFKYFLKENQLLKAASKTDHAKHVLVFDTKLCLFQNDFWLAAAGFLVNITTLLGILCE
jgi:hypothetical protein